MTETKNLSVINGAFASPQTGAIAGYPQGETVYLIVEGRLLRDCITAVLQKANRKIQSDWVTLCELGASIDSVAQPDLVMVSLAATDLASAFATIRSTRTHWPLTRWIVLSRVADRDFIRDGLKSGVDGFLLEESSVEVLRLVTDLVLLGHSPLPTDVARVLVDEPVLQRPIELERAIPVLMREPAATCAAATLPAPLGRRVRELSGREQDILRCLSHGMSNKVIARELVIAEATVKAHVKALLRKMQVSNRTQAAICATEVLSAVAHQSLSSLAFHASPPALGCVPAMVHRAALQPPIGL
jgi:two-component system nitrate/nitrite response regulator NarL